MDRTTKRFQFTLAALLRSTLFAGLAAGSSAAAGTFELYALFLYFLAFFFAAMAVAVLIGKDWAAVLMVGSGGLFLVSALSAVGLIIRMQVSGAASEEITTFLLLLLVGLFYCPLGCLLSWIVWRTGLKR